VAAGGRRFFFSALGKILILLELRTGYRPQSAQNLGSKGLTAKILWNKELAGSAVGPSDWIWFGRTSQLCAFYLLSQGCASHGDDFLLWITVENPMGPLGRSLCTYSLRFREATGWVLPESRNTYGGVTVADRALAQLGDQVGREALVY